MGHESKDPSLGAERRHLTVMFCDLVGSSALSTQFDPEDFREIVGAYQTTLAAVVDRFGGYLGRYVGDGALVYFGYPEAHEDDAERALLAAFAIIEVMPEISHSLSPRQRVNLAVRIGVASGLVVAGDIAGAGTTEQHAVVGQTPNLAARLQGLAEPNSVLITSATRQLLGDQFEYENLGPHDLKGFPEPTVIWRVIQPSAGTDALRGDDTAAGQSPLSTERKRRSFYWSAGAAQKQGRDNRFCWPAKPASESRASPSRSARVWLTSRIFNCVTSATRSPKIAHSTQSSLNSNTKPGIAARIRQRKDWPSCSCYWPDRTAPKTCFRCLPVLMSIPTNGQYAPLQFSPRQQKERTLTALADHLIGLARHRPVFALVEDMHWMDPSSRELFDLIWERIATASILLLVTTREQHISLAWSKASHASTIALNRLDHDDSVTMVTRVARGKAFPPPMLEEIIQRTDGVPLHVEELTKSIIDSGALSSEQDHKLQNGADVMRDLPVSLRGSLMARLDQLGPAKRIAQHAAVIGREFSLRLITQVSGLSPQALRAGLEKLVRSELIYEYGSVSDPTYVFKHALVQEAAHDSLLLKDRRDLHLRTAKALHTHAPQLAETQPELLAHHYYQAGDVQTAAHFWMSAGRRSIERCAFVEATSHLRKVLGVLAGLPSSRNGTSRNSMWRWRLAARSPRPQAMPRRKQVKPLTARSNFAANWTGLRSCLQPFMELAAST